MIAWSRVSSLRDEIGNEDFRDIVEVFLEEVDEVMADIAQVRSAEAMGNTLHFLKGSALNLGFEAFAELCHAGETRLQQYDAANVDVEQLREVYGQSRRALLTGLATDAGSLNE